MGVDAVLVAIGLGANLPGPDGRPPGQTIAWASGRLSEILQDLRTSPVRATRPVGDPDQPDYLNAVAVGTTRQAPRELLRQLLAIEQEAGRQRDPARRFGPRVLDLDLLLYGNLAICEPGLAVPHPRMHERRFVLAPLAGLCPAWRHPLLGLSMADLFARLPADRR